MEATKRKEMLEMIRENLDNFLKQINNPKIPKIYITNELWIPAKNTFVSMLGLSYSGKTTFVKEHFYSRQGITINQLNADDLPFEMAMIYPNLELLSRNEVMEYFIKRLKQTLQLRGDLTVCDNNNLTVDIRRIILNRLSSYYNNSALVVLNPPWQVILEQANQRKVKIEEREEIEKLMLEVQLSDPQKYFVGYDKVFITDQPRQVKVIIRK